MKYKKLILLLLIVLFVYNSNAKEVKPAGEEHWIINSTSDFPDIPVKNGLSGAFTGIDNNVLIVAGGSYYDRPLNEAGERTYLDSIFVCISEGNKYQWKFAGRLPFAVAYGAAVSINKGLLCIGGQNGNKKYKDVFLLHWDNEKQTVVLSNIYPDLPVACSHISAAEINKTIYVAGGKIHAEGDDAGSNNFWKLKLEDNSAWKWQLLDPIPGGPKFSSLLIRQTNGDYNCLFLAGGRSLSGYLTDFYMFDQKFEGKADQWKKLANIPIPSLDGSAVAVGASQIFIISGLERHEEGNILVNKDSCCLVKEVWSYNTITDVWYKAGELPQATINSAALMWKGQVVLPGGELSGGGCSSKVISFSINPFKRGHFSGLDYMMLFLYLAIITWLGYFFSSKNKSSKDFFLGGQKIPFWAAGLSMMAAQVSSIGFMAIPAKSFATNWSYFAGVFTWFIAVPIVIYGFVPFYRKLNVTSAYEYLDKRFNSFIRLFIATLYLLFQLIGRLGAIIFLPAIALSAVTGMDVIVCILIIGCLSTTYTVLGGMHAVIWIDVIQSLVMVGSIFICIVYIFFNIDGGVNEFVKIAWNDHKFSFGSMDINLTAAVFWVIIIGNIFNRIGTMSTDQSVVQRYLTTRNEKETAKALWTDVAVSIPWALFVFGLGTALYVFYKANPHLIDPVLANDEIVPFFIGQNLPSGISGVVIAGIFAASMSSVDSSIHSSTTVLMRDSLHRRIGSKSEKQKVSLARWITGCLGLMGTLIAVVMTFYDITSVWDVVLEFAGLFTGAITGVFVLGIFTTKANGKGAVVGTLISAAILLIVKNFTPLHFFLYSGIGIISSITIGYLASFLFRDEKPLEGLTIYTITETKK